MEEQYLWHEVTRRSDLPPIHKRCLFEMWLPDHRHTFRFYGVRDDSDTITMLLNRRALAWIVIRRWSEA